ncbi:MAG TPA: hypothetical protein VGL38_07430 [bacterium]|jgi:hypothetical protein
MKCWLLILLPLLFFGCDDRVTSAPGDTGGEPMVTVSKGLMPLAVGNWWEYRTDAAEPESTCTFRRSIVAVREIRNNRYYLFVDSIRGSAPDTVFYLRNERGTGVMQLPYPADSCAREELLFRYPYARSGNYYWFDQDCVLVLYNFPGGPCVIGDSVLRTMMYQRFEDGDRHRSVSYAVSSDSLGLMSQTGDGPGGYGFDIVTCHVNR